MDKFIVKRGRVESVDDGESSPPYAQSAVVTTDNVQATSCKTIVPVGTYWQATVMQFSYCMYLEQRRAHS